MNTLKKVEKSIKNGNEKEFEKLLERIEKKDEIHPELEKKIKELGEAPTPIEHKDLYSAILDSPRETALFILDRTDFDKYSAKEIGAFLNKVKNTVTSLQLDDRSFKSTPATENCNLPNFLEADDLARLYDKQLELKAKISALIGRTFASMSKEERELWDDTQSKLEKANKDYEDLAFKISGLNKDSLTEWEQSLVMTQVYTCSIEAELSAMGKGLYA